MTRRVQPWPSGAPCWSDLTVPDPDAARDFYEPLTGWAYLVGPREYGGYCVNEIDGAAASGIAVAREGTAPQWNLYLASVDLAATAAAIVAAGGSVLHEPWSNAPFGGALVAADPTGARFSVWQAGEHTGWRIFAEPGAPCWFDLRSTDPDAARAFYGEVFGWEYQPLEMAGPDYATFSLPGGEPLGGTGGMMGIPGHDSHWLVYLTVRDMDEALQQVEAGGGAVMMPAFDTPFGRMAPVVDPFGAPLWLAQLVDDASTT
jgi:predicted enzyme related to lactoylglutathione lyase